ncbi:5-methylcytosine restriction system specificity protein McrC [Gordonia malaquae]|uniref:5-methylcytosine restriction system specificity protein McrC n=1 Tax=Gordonia malaquae TaxID=410332 RepID=UPI0030175BA2
MFTAGAGTTRIDVRSVWFLLLYASDYVAKLTDADRMESLLDGERDNDLLDALAETFTDEVASRIRSMLAVSYRARVDSLTRVRGRIDHLGTARRRSMESGRVICRFHEQTIDLPRYRFMLVTLRRAAQQAQSDRVRRKCLTTAQMLARSGVSATDPLPTEMAREQYGHADSADQRLVQLGRLVRDMCAPEHVAGRVMLPAIVRDERELRRLFESAVRGFYSFHLGRAGASVRAAKRPWPATGDPAHLALLPLLNADVVIRGGGRQTIVECKFAPVFDRHFGKAMVKPHYVRQVYAYASVFAELTSDTTCGLLLGALVDGSPGRDLDVDISGIPVRVRQIDLTRKPNEIRAALREAIVDWH